MVYSVCFSPDGNGLASVSISPQTQTITLKIWDAQTGHETLSLEDLLDRGPNPTLCSLCFSPDGHRLASAAGFKFKIWDVQTGQEIHSLEGHGGSVHSVCFSPDGQRLASASGNQTVNVWDAQTAQETLSLKWPAGFVRSVAFSPDGQRLAGASIDAHTVTVWDARPLSPEVEIAHEAWIIFQSLYNPRLPNAWVIAALRADQTITESVRKEALAIAERLPALDEHLRLNRASWAVVSQRGASADQYSRALQWAEAACRLQPEDGDFLNTLGVAQYRAGRFPEALQTLQRADQLNRPRFKGSIPGDLAFLAMTTHRLGKKDQAQNYLDEARRAMAKPQWNNDEETKRFLSEAEAQLKEPQRAKP
jgi:hypothetical protein